MSNKINLLDHGFVRLVDHMGDDLSVIRSARVSYDAEWRSGEDDGKDKKLINYLLKNRHTSPFEHVQFTFDVKAPIFVFRQWHRHRTWSFNEVSARYTELPEEFYVPESGMIGIQAKDNKQMRDIEVAERENAKSIIRLMERTNKASFDVYKALIEEGVPRELARTVLPVATYSHMFASVDLHNLLHFLNLRLHEHSQYEIRVYAEAMLELIKPIVPHVIEAWENLRNDK